MSAEKDSIIRELIARRNGAGLSLREVARRSGISVGGLCELEQGKHSPVLSNLQAWARVLGYDVVLTRVILPGVTADPEHDRG